MKLARKPTTTLLVALLGVLGASACFQVGEDIAVMSDSVNLTYHGLVAAVVAIVAFCGALAAAFWPGDTAAPAAGDVQGGPPRDEIDNFAREINRQIVEKNDAYVAALEQVRHTDRLTTVGHLAAGVAHEFGTPLSVMSGRAELIATSNLPRDKVVHSARVIVEQADRMTAMIRQLLDFSRLGAGGRVNVDLRQVVTTTADLISGIANKAKVEIACEVGEEPVPVCVDTNTMQQALTNIALNGIQAMPHGGRLCISIESRHLQPPPGVSEASGMYHCVIIEDDGAGIAPAHLQKVFEPFFTTKPVGEGTGLGLPVAHGIVAEHGGWIAVDSVEGRGSRFSIMLPQARAAAGRREEAA